MNLWCLEIPSYVPDEDRPFIDDLRLLNKTPNLLYLYSNGNPRREDWVEAARNLKTHSYSVNNLDDLLEECLRRHYPGKHAFDGFTNDGIAMVQFNVSPYPGTQVLASLHLLPCLTVEQ